MEVGKCYHNMESISNGPYSDWRKGHWRPMHFGKVSILSMSLSLSRWGHYRLDSVVASGTADTSPSSETSSASGTNGAGREGGGGGGGGLHLEELSVTSGPARLLIKGSLLCPDQEASLHVTDFPLDLLQV